ncbi:sigma-70 family RNA polymerase sigma factor [Streptomyces sp. NPDC046887]|uniref:RNA polymerase sigma factor n=1 Tax=Streptomyces sp. NPDC046887 TaxID=3155472 RepID=UPI0033FBD923
MVNEEARAAAVAPNASPTGGPSPAPAARASQTRLLQRLHDLYQRDYLRSLISKLHGRFRRGLTVQACEDLAHEAYLRLLERARAGRLTAAEDLDAYLYTTACNLAASEVRRRVETAVADSAIEGLAQGEETARDVDPMDDLVRPAIEAMPPSRCRQVVRLQSQGLTDPQIAERLDIPKARVHRDRYRALIDLRRRLAGHIRDGQGNRGQAHDMEKDG